MINNTFILFLIIVLLIFGCNPNAQFDHHTNPGNDQDVEDNVLHGDDTTITSEDIILSATSENIYQDEAVHIFARVKGNTDTDKRVTFALRPIGAGTIEYSGLYIPDLTFSGTATITVQSVGNCKAKKDFEIIVHPGSNAIYVNDNNPGTGNNRKGSLSNPYNTINEAVTAGSDSNIIRIAEGQYNEQVILGGTVSGMTITPKPLLLIGGFSSDFNSRVKHTSRVYSDNADGVFYLYSGLYAGSTYLIDGFTISSGMRGINICDNGGSKVDSRVIISNNIVENNYLQLDAVGLPLPRNRYVFGAGIDINKVEPYILNNIIRNNTGAKGPAMSLNQTDIDHSAFILNNIFKDNRGFGNHCGGVYMTVRTGFFLNNIVDSNKMTDSFGPGGGVLVDGGRSMVFNDSVYFEMAYNTYTNNFALSHGGAVFIDDGANVRMHNELIYGNTSGVDGAAIAIGGPRGTPDARTEICYSTIACNSSSTGLGDGLKFSGDPGEAIVRNCIFFNHPETGPGHEFRNQEDSDHYLTVDYSDFNDVISSGNGNINADPLFHDLSFHVDTVSGQMIFDAADFHLKALNGRWNSESGLWETDTSASPCIGAALPAGTNMGRYGNTGERSY